MKSAFLDFMLDRVALKSIVKGFVTYIPGWQRIRKKEGGGANSARYCYSVWLRHRILAARAGFTSHPDFVAELGPGDSIGTGLAALLSGCRGYLAFDIVPFTALERNLGVLDELVELFQNRSPIPGAAEFPTLHPGLDDYAFPADLYSDGHLEEALSEVRVRAIRQVLLDSKAQSDPTVNIRYVAPWNLGEMTEAASVDMIFSQAVMEQVDDLLASYEAMYQWLRPGGIMCHEIDFKCHGTARNWNGHWTYSDPIWKIIGGQRPYFLNRKTCGHHLDLIKNAGFEIVYVQRKKSEQNIRQEDLCKGLRNTSNLDLATSSAYVIARKGK
jgi:hypothetical protein